ncbi:aluminum-activated malate transporter 8 [Phtheirospermum japonicum]|uniref:Aluminum-activated malate transporter 8 n=1 Tax=Phtheirospermum japonicum TaxID=374723 RepID=A0A830BPH9_9LAMI|nr:aluminum-activated malate transporter 8 [Phtheirospermum japonicum]
MCLFLKAKFVQTMKNTKKIGKDDPRRIVHSIKVGLALTLYDGFGQAGMWAVLTVVVVFEYTVGGTICKSLNRGGATLLAGALGVGAAYLASLCGDRGEPFVLGILVFILAAVSTFTRFFPNVKRRYDYGVLIFILTFSLVAVSGSQVTEILQLARQRLATILIGGATCIVISISVGPVWAGQDLHNLVAGNIDKLADFLQGFEGEICSCSRDEIRMLSSKDTKEKTLLQGYKSVLNSKATEESLANFAWWEPGHGRFRLHHPWKQYLKIGSLVRECACLMETLMGCIDSKSQVGPSDFHLKIQPACVKMCTESSKALKELASAVKSMSTFPLSATETHVRRSKAAADHLKAIVENSDFPAKTELGEIMHLLVAASVLVDVIKCVEKLSDSINELSQKARFEKPESTASPDKQQHLLIHRGIVKPVVDNRVLNEIGETRGDPPEIFKKLRPENCVHVVNIESSETTFENKNPHGTERVIVV